MSVTIHQQAALPSKAAIDRLRHWILVTPAKFPEQTWRQIPYGAVLLRRVKRLPKSALTKPHTFELPNANGTLVSHASCAPGDGAFERLTLARKLVALHWPFEPNEIGITALGFTPDATERAIEACVAAAVAAAVDMPSYKQKSIRHTLKELRIFGFAASHGYERTLAEGEGNALARYLTSLPPNTLTPGHYRQRLEALAQSHGWQFEFLDVAALESRRANAFLSVARGSPVADAGIVRLSYRPDAGRVPRIALVGKGICYDTGGVNVKSNKHMLGMHGDMQGSAVAVGTLLALSQLKAPLQIDTWLALATNHIGSRAYVPNEVVHAADGTSIEVVHTDAEGRMVLADTLVFASRARPQLIIDYATLTGACVYSLGKAYSGVFSNRDQWLPILIEAGRASGERVWPFPLDQDYDKDLESEIADVKQCTQDGEADHILAARFLKRFIKYDSPWVHIDLSAAEHKDGLAHVPTTVTGFGVRFTCALLLDHKLL